MNSHSVTVRVDPRLKARAGKILAKEHLTLSVAIRTFLTEVARQKKMPIELATAPRVVSGRTLWKIKRAQQARDLARGARGKSSKGHVLISSRAARGARIQWPDVDLND